MQNDYRLPGEIRLLEKKKSDILLELQRLDATKKEEYIQHTQIIKDYTKRKNDLIDQVEQLRQAMTTLTTAYNSAKESMETFTYKMQADAKEEVRIAQIAAEKIRTDINNEKRESERYLDDAKKTKLITGELKLHLDSQIKENLTMHTSLVSRQQQDEERHKLAEDRISDMQARERRLQGEIDSLEERKLALETDIANKNQEMENRAHMVIEAEKELAKMDRATKQWDEILNMKSMELENTAKLINDQRQTLDRAVEEMRQKGVTI